MLRQIAKLNEIFYINLELPNRNVGLDIMRGLGVLMVFCGHSLHVFQPFVSGVSEWFNLFRNAIELFFALSGFLIGNILIKYLLIQKEFTLSTLVSFYKRRWYRTLPLYYLGIITNLLVGYYITKNIKDFNYTFWFFLQNFSSSSFYFFPVSYSLAIEEWFYLLFPLLLWLGVKLFKSAPLKVMIAVAIIFIIYFTYNRYQLYLIQKFHWDTHLRKSILARLDSSVYGIILSVLFYKYKNWFSTWRVKLFFIGLFLHLFAMYFYLYDYGSLMNNVFYFNLMPLSFAFFLPQFYFFQFKEAIFNKLFTWLSLIAYSFYIFHLSPLMELLYLLIPDKSFIVVLVWFLLYSLFTFGLSTLIYKYIEHPITQLREGTV